MPITFPHRGLGKSLSTRRGHRPLVESLESRKLLAAEVFTDNLAEGWNIYEWDSQWDAENSSPVAVGAASLSVEYQQGWGGIIFDSEESFDVDPADELRFQIHGGSGGQDVGLFVIDGNDQWTYIETIATSSGWQDYSLNLDSVPFLDKISGFAVQEFLGNPISPIYLDEIYLQADEGSGGGPDGMGTPGTPIANIYIDDLSEDWQNWSWETEIDFSNSFAESGQSIMATFQSEYAGIYISAPEQIRTGEFNQIEFSIHGGTGGHNLTVNALDADRTFLYAFRLQPTGDAWQRYVLSLDEVGDPSYLTGFVLQNDNGVVGEELYLDNIILSYHEPETLPTKSGPSVVVDTALVNGMINEAVYGLNFADEQLASEIDLPVERWGGNSTSRYNYTLDSWNAGSDWYFLNVAADNDPSQLPAESSVNQLIGKNQQLGADSIITIGMTGYVSSQREKAGSFHVDKYGPQQDVEPFDANIGNGVRLDGSLITDNDPLDVSMEAGPEFAKEWVEYLTQTFGTAAEGGVQYYALGNEPMLWNSTHRDVHSEPASYGEVLEKGIAYASAIKQADPTAKVTGPVSWGWTGYFYSALDAAAGGAWWENPQDRNANGGQAFIPWYLEEMAAAEQQSGQRLLDFLDVHYYPQNDGVALTRDGGSLSTQEARLKSTRSLWDATYVDPTWINEEVQLVPRMQGWIDEFYPGTNLAITEYNFGGIQHISGALAQADVLGIFGAQGVDLATMWGPPDVDDAASFAFRMFRNYDGSSTEGGKFGELSLGALSSNTDQVSSFASIRASDGALTLMLINKSTSPLEVPVELPTEFVGSTAEVYRYGEANDQEIVREADLELESSSTSIVLPGYSITLLEIGSETNTNLPPNAVADSYQVDQGQPLSVPTTTGLLANDSDPDGDPLIARLVQSPANGELTVSDDGSFSYAPNMNFAGADTFLYVATDGEFESELTTVTITVNPTAPVGEMGLLVLDNSRRVHEYDFEGTEQAQVRFDLPNRRPRGMVASEDGSTLWTVNLDGLVSILNRDGETLGSWQAEGLRYPEGIALEGSDLLIVDRGTDRVHVFENAANHNAGNHAESYSWSLDSQNRAPFDLTTDGTHVWVVNNTRRTDRVFIYNLEGELEGSWTIDAANARPTGITIDPNDPNDIWIVDVQSDVVFRYEDGARMIGGEVLATSQFELSSQNRAPQAIAFTTSQPSWTNLHLPADVTGDSVVSSLDVLMIVNYLNEAEPSHQGTLLSGAERNFQTPYYDVNGDRAVSAVDALLTINALHQRQTRKADNFDADSVDSFFIDLGNSLDEDEEEWLLEDVPLLS